MESLAITGRIEEKAFELLEEHPEGIRWSELNAQIKASDPSFHPKTINGTVWKLPEKYPERVTKTGGLFRLVKYNN
jgi:hypothetical protein